MDTDVRWWVMVVIAAGIVAGLSVWYQLEKKHRMAHPPGNVSRGEFVVKAKAVQRYGLRAMNEVRHG